MHTAAGHKLEEKVIISAHSFPSFITERAWPFQISSFPFEHRIMSKSQLRKRRISSSGPTHNEKDISNSSLHEESPKIKQKGKIVRALWMLLSFPYAILHMVALYGYSKGIVLRGGFHNGDECTMTYSMREFLEIKTNHVPTSEISKQYKLYKFIDKRDPRYKALSKTKQPLTKTSDWCNGNSDIHPKNIVLYIPGHWGSYSQSRSVGAHGIQSTGTGSSEVQQMYNALANNLWTGDSADENTFVYDVYSVDFAEQGAALHGEFLRSQSEYVASTVLQLAEMCNVTSVTTVGHSMGGIVARLTPINHPQTHSLMRNIITLATPHNNPVYAFDRTIWETYNRIKRYQNKDTLIISISGGLRDEMIETSAGNVMTHSSFSIPAFTMFGEYGMDHQAIVWCHQVLDPVRRIIWVLSRSQHDDSTERRELVRKRVFKKEFESYEFDVSRTWDKLRTTALGDARSIVVAMPYNVPYLLGLFALLCAMRCAFPDSPYQTDPLFLMASIKCAIEWGVQMDLTTTSISAMVANVLYHILWWSIESRRGFLLAYPLPKKFTVKTFAIGSSLVVSFSCLVLLAIMGFGKMKGLDSVAYFYGVLVMYIALFVMIALDDKACGNSHFKVTFSCLVLVTSPALLAGSVAVLSWEGLTRASSWLLLVQLSISVIVVALTQTCMQLCSNRFIKICRCLLSLYGTWILCKLSLEERGNIFWLSHLIPVLAGIHALMDILQFALEILL